jgi:hypothetical protein
LAFAIVPEGSTSRIEWDGEVAYTADQLLEADVAAPASSGQEALETLANKLRKVAGATEWVGTATQLRDALEKVNLVCFQSVESLGRRVKASSDALRGMGVEVVWERTGQARNIRVRATAPLSPSQPSQPSSVTGTEEPASGHDPIEAALGDGCDSNDGHDGSDGPVRSP